MPDLPHAPLRLDPLKHEADSLRSVIVVPASRANDYALLCSLLLNAKDVIAKVRRERWLVVLKIFCEERFYLCDGLVALFGVNS